VAFAVCAVTSTAAPARAAFDANVAQAAAERAREANRYTFCDKPRLPLSSRALSVCGHAVDVTSCAGFAEACKSPGVLPAGCVEPNRPMNLHWTAPPILGQIARVLIWGVLIALAAFVVVHLVRMRRKSQEERGLSDGPEPEAPAPGPTDVAAPSILDEEGLLLRAEKHALAGEYAQALQLYLGAALRSLDRRGALRLSRDRTNGEYVKACADPAARPLLRDIVREVERVQFGREAPTQERVGATGQRAIAIVRTLAATVLVMAVLAMSGCGSADPCSRAETSGDDPAGLDLLSDVLEGQGYRVSRLGRSLASLSQPAWWQSSGGAVILDTDVVPVDSETWDHIESWVSSGGVLCLAGSPEDWPHDLGLAAEKGTAGPLRVLLPGWYDADDESERLDGGVVVRGAALTLPDDAAPLAWTGDAVPYAAILERGKGSIVALATDELFTNAALAHRGNAAAMSALLTRNVRAEFLVAEPDDGVTPPSSPFSSLVRAGLGLGLVHALLAALVLFLAAGIRLARPRHAAPPVRRAFAEHVRAVGGLYERTSNAAHALAAYTRFAEERLRSRMPRGVSDVPEFLALRTSHSVDECRALWDRAVASRAAGPARGDELAILKRLSALCTVAFAPGRSRHVESEGS
jgi:hypothetical protein